MPKQAWNIFIGFLAIVIIGLSSFSAWSFWQQLEKAKADLAAEQQKAESAKTEGASSVMQLKGKNDTLEKNLAETMKMVEGLEADKSTLEQAKTELERVNNSLAAENTRLQNQIREATSLKEKLTSELTQQLNDKDVTINQLQGKLSVDILNRVLFDLGKADLKDEGKKILSDVAKVLENLPNRPIHVIGHTDNIPFKGGTGRFRSNWDLSAGRAVAAVQFLQEQAGIDPMRLAAVGHSEFHPIAANDTDQGRAQNRRITLVIMPEELKVEEPPAPTPEPEPAPEAEKPVDDSAEKPAEDAAKAPAEDAAPPEKEATPENAGSNVALPDRANSTNTAPELPKIPQPRARPESATPPKG